MLSPIHDRFSGLTQIMHLTKNESHELNRAITHIATLQLQSKNNPLKLNELPQNTTDFLKIHKKIERLRSNEKLTAVEVKLLDKINATARRFEQIVLLSLSSGNARDLEEVESLYTALSTLNHDPLLEGKISPEFQKVLEALAEKMRTVADNYKDVAVVHQKLESYEENADLAIESLVSQHQALEQGEAVFSLDGDLTLLNLFDQLIGFYKTYEHKESLPLYHAELISRLTQEAYTLRFNREEFRTEYQAAVEVEVLKTLRDLHHETPPDPESEERYEVLLLTLIEAKNKIELAKATLDSHIESLNQPEESTEKLFKEFASLHLQLEGDLEFLENQIRILSEKQTVGFFGRMKIYSRGRQVERNVRIMKEAEEEVPKGWGTKLLHAAMWGLYLTPQIGALAQFAGRTYQAIATGESPLKETADMMSNAAFARQVGELPVEEQQSLDVDVNTIQGVLNGYIPLTESIAEKRPEAAEYLKGLETGPTGVPDNQVVNPAADNSIQIPILSSEEANLHALRYMGGQVRGHYETAGKQLAFENPLGSFSSSDQFFNFVPPEEKPQSMFTLFGQECADSIREAKTGVPLDENVHFQNLQEHAQATFGAKLPTEWFSGWLLPQEWSDARLGSFQDWFAHSLECQVRQHIGQQDIHVKSEASAGVPLLLLGAAAVDDSAKSQPVKEETSLLAPDSRQFEVIEDLADEIYPGHEIFQEPVTSSASRLSSPFKVAFDVYRYVSDKVLLFWKDKADPSFSDKTLLHQFGDFFGQNTGLEGYNHLEALRFYQGLISSLIEKDKSEHLQKLGNSLDQAIHLSTLLLYRDINQFRNQFKTALQKLNPNESVFFVGGWRGSPSGHAIMYEVIKQSDDAFSFRLYNTGPGIGHHISKTARLKDKIIPYVEILNIALEKILQRPFLLELQSIKKKDNAWEEGDIYKGLMMHLEGEVGNVKYGVEALMNPQRSGTCAFMSLNALFYHSNVNKKISQKIQFQLLSAGITNYIVLNREELRKSSQVQNLLTKSLEEYSRITANLYDKGVINDFDLAETSMRVKEFQQALDSGKKAYQNEIERKVTKFNLNEPLIFWKNSILVSDNFIINPSNAILSQKAPSFYVSGLKDWKPIKETVVADLTSFMEILKQGTSEKSHLSVLLEIQTLVQKLDLTKMDFEIKEIPKVIAQLHALGFLYYENIQRSCAQHPEMHCQLATPKMYFTINRILYQAAKLVHKFNPRVSKTLLENPFRKQERVMTNPSILFIDPRFDDQFRQIDDSIFSDDAPERVSEKLFQEEQFGIVPIPKVDHKLADIMTFIGGKTYHQSREHYSAAAYQLYDLGALSLGLERLPLSLTSFTSNSSLRIETKVLINGKGEIESSFAIFHPINKLGQDYPAGINYEDLAKYHLKQIAPKIQDGETEALFKKIYFAKQKNELSQNDLITFSNLKLSVNWVHTLTLLGLVTNRKLLIKETLSYFSRHSDLFVNPDYQAFFINLMFTPGLLLDDLDQSCGFLVAKHLSDISVKNFEYYKSKADLKTAVFFLQLNRLFKVYVDYAEAKYIERVENSESYVSQLNRLFSGSSDYISISPGQLFLDTQAEIRTLLGQENLGTDVRWLLNKELALSYQHTQDLTNSQALELLEAVFSLNSYFNTGYNDEKWTRLEIEELLQKHTDAFIKLSQGSGRDQVLNKLAASVTGKAVEKEWKADPAYPFFTTTDGVYQINLAACTINAEAAQCLPIEFSMHPEVLGFFDNNLPKISTRIGGNGFVVEFEGHSYRMFQNKGEIIIQREFELQGRRLWGQYIKSNNELKAVLPSFLIKASKVWVCAENPVSLIMTNRKNQVSARLEHQHIYQVNPATGKDTGLVLDNNEGSTLSKSLSRFEDKGYFSIWIDGDTKLPQQIDFPRLGTSGITFKRQKVDGQERMVSEAFTGFYLAEKQYFKDLQDDFSFLLLENASGEQQVILAKQYFKKGEGSRREEKKALETSKDYLDKDIETSYLSQQSYFQYKVNSKTGNLEAASSAANLYLSMRYLWKMRYNEAETLIRGVSPFLQPFSSEESEILTKISGLSSLSGDQDPRATALSLHAAYLLKKNARDFGVQVSLERDIFRLYSTYLNQLNNIYGVRLNSEEELFLLNTLPDKTEAMINRFIELDPIRGKLAQAQFSQMEIIASLEEERFGNERTDLLASPDDLTKVLSNPSTNLRKEFTPYLRKKFTIDSFSSVLMLVTSPSSLWGLNEERVNKIKQGYQTITGLGFPENVKDWKKELISYLTGVDFTERNEIDWKKELAAALRLMTRTPMKESNTLAWVLLGILEHPDEIQIPTEVIANPENNNLFDQDKFKEIYEQILIPKLLHFYPQIAQSGVTPFDGLKKGVEFEKSTETISSENLLNLKYQHSIDIKRIRPFHTSVINPLNAVISIKPTAIKQDLVEYANTLSDVLVDEELTLRDQELYLLSKINRPSEDFLERAKSVLMDIGQSRKPLTIDDLIYLYWNRDAARFHEMNPTLSVKEIQQLESGIQKMLIQSTHVQQIKRVLEQVELIKRDSNSGIQQEQLKQLNSIAEGTHNYNIDNHPEYLVMEHYANILLEPEQVTKLDLLQLHEGKIHDRKYLSSALEMIIEGGNMKALKPLYEIINARYVLEAELATQKEQEGEIVIGTALSAKQYEENKDFPFKIMTLSKAFSASKGLEAFADIFDAGLSGSLNLLPVKEEIPKDYLKRNNPPFGLFNEYQKPICALKIISEDEVVMVDQHDANSEGAFYDLNLGLYQVEGEIPDFLESDKFLRKVVQAKFFNGETHYTKKEIPLLRQWIKEKGVERMSTLFVKHILKFKVDSRAAFPGSILDKTLK